MPTGSDGAGLRVLYPAEMVRCQLVGEDALLVPDGPSSFYAFPTFHDECRIPIVEEWHPLYPAGFRWAGLWGVQRYSSHDFPHSCSMCSPLLIHFPFFALLCIMMFTWDTHVMLALLLVLPLTLLIYCGQSMSTVLMALLMSIRWATPQMSWATLFLRVHEQWIFFILVSFLSILSSQHLF